MKAVLRCQPCAASTYSMAASVPNTMMIVSPTQLIGSCEALLPERAKYPCDCVVVIIVSVEVPRAKTQTPPDSYETKTPLYRSGRKKPPLTISGLKKMDPG